MHDWRKTVMCRLTYIFKKIPVLFWQNFIYIYIYIGIHWQTFVILPPINEAKHTRCPKLGSKPGWLHVSQITYCRAFINLLISEGIFTYIYIYIYILHIRKALHYAWVATSNSSRECSAHFGQHLYCQPQTDCFVVGELIGGDGVDMWDFPFWNKRLI